MNPTNRSTKEEIENWVIPISERLGLKNYTVAIEGSSAKGDGYLSDITFVEIVGKTEENEEKTLNLVLKCAKKSKQLRETFPVRSVFENEIYFYTEILPTYLKFQEEKGVKEPFDNVAKCYDTLILEEMEVLILQNLKKLDFDLWDRKRPLNGEHLRTIMKLYGKLHAISFALRDQKPDVFKKFAKELKDVIKLMEDSWQSEEGNLYGDLINVAREKGELEIAEKALLIQKDIKKINELTDPSDPYAVILHGDCWNNNFMFKYKDDQKTQPSQVRFLDFQLCRLASPVYDLSYFLFCCISEDDVQNFDELQHIYYDSFSEFLRELGSDPDRLFPFQELMNQWKKFARFGLMVMPSITRICLSDQEDVVDMAEAVEDGVNIMDAFSYSVKDIEEYARRNLPVMKLAIEREFI